MIAQTSSQKILNFLNRFTFRAVVIVLLLAIAGTVYQTAATESDKRKFPAPGNLIDVGGFKMHIYCEGEGNPTVILESMSGGTSVNWGWIQPEVQKDTQVCVYDRAGYGWSEPDPMPPTLARTSQNLHRLLANANIEGPYVMVGHSLGGVYVRQFSADNPDDVVGVVLLDEANPKQFVKYPELFGEGEDYLKVLGGFIFATKLGIAHVYFAFGGEMDFAELSEPQKSQLKTFWSSPQFFEAQGAEIREAPGIWSEALNLKDLGNMPLMIISRGVNLDHEWNAYQDNLMTLSTNSLHLTINGANHTALIFEQKYAQIVSDAILQTVESLRTGTQLGE